MSRKIRRGARRWSLVFLLQRMAMARRTSDKCPPGTDPTNPIGWIPPGSVPPGTQVPDEELPPEEPPEEPPPPEFPPHEGETLSDGVSDVGWETDEVLEEVVLGSELAEEVSEEEDEVVEDVVEAAPTGIFGESVISSSRETDQVLVEVVFAPPVHVPEIVIRGVIDRSVESDEVVEQVIAAGPPEDPDLPPPPSEEHWDRILQNATYQGDLLVPAGKRWLVGANVKILGNLRTEEGTIGMRPGSSLEFVGVDPSKYVGGGLTYQPEFANDYGIWIGPEGTLDIRATPKIRWNRTGVDPTWAAGDELWISPTAVGDRTPRRWFPGDPIPRTLIPANLHALVDSFVPEDWLENGIPAEVMNVSSDVVIKYGHIHIHSHHPQVIKHPRLEGMGILHQNFRNSTGDPARSGRYVIHQHHGFEGSRGTVIEGVAAINSRGRVYVPHFSHGVTLRGCVSVNSFAEGFWWDMRDQTNDVLVDRLCISGVYVDRAISGEQPRFSAFRLATSDEGTFMTMKDCAASGARGSGLSVGFDWETGPGKLHNPIWGFDQGNVAHNNQGPGVRFWNNSPRNHVVANYISYHNKAGIENGAYNNANRYENVLSLNDSVALILHTSSSVHEVDAGPGRYENIVLKSTSGAAFSVDDDSRNLPSQTYLEIIDCTLLPGPGQPKVYVGRGNNPWFARFIRSGVLPGDITFTATNGNEGSEIFIDPDGTGDQWRVRFLNGVKVVTEL